MLAALRIWRDLVYARSRWQNIIGAYESGTDIWWLHEDACGWCHCLLRPTGTKGRLSPDFYLRGKSVGHARCRRDCWSDGRVIVDM
jgi:hypothetical protein